MQNDVHMMLWTVPVNAFSRQFSNTFYEMNLMYVCSCRTLVRNQKNTESSG